ncbi:MAG: TadA family conjugal transfer-associated ATPase [Actinomycetaceae bacterium]|nr:TadA family conjugal transfer-associated ATPase [Actinomycetaceae bacterium]
MMQRRGPHSLDADTGDQAESVPAPIEARRTEISASQLRTPPADAVHKARKELAYGADFSQAFAASIPEAIGTADVVGRGRELRRALSGAGSALQPLLEDPEVTDVLVNGVNGVWIDRGFGMERVHQLDGYWPSRVDVRALAVRLASACGQRLDDSMPIVDGTFPGGMRLHAVLEPISAEGALISLRTHRPVAYSLDDLQESGTFGAGMRVILDALIAQRANVMISGATGSGKTTLLSALLSSVGSHERILVIEESAELFPQHPHVIHLQERHANVQGAGAVPMPVLVRAAMRMRPDRIVLGECRGAEVRDVLSALNTGHDGGWATIHANSAEDVPSRLVALGALAGMSESVVAAQAASALDAVIHVQRTAAGRRVAQIGTFVRRQSELSAQLAVRVDEVDGSLHAGPGWDRLGERLGIDASFFTEANAQADVGVLAGHGMPRACLDRRRCRDVRSDKAGGYT